MSAASDDLEQFWSGDGYGVEQVFQYLEAWNGRRQNISVGDREVGESWVISFLRAETPASSFLTLLERYPDAAGQGLLELTWRDAPEHLAAVVRRLKPEHFAQLLQHWLPEVRELAIRLSGKGGDDAGADFLPRVSDEMDELEAWPLGHGGAESEGDLPF